MPGFDIEAVDRALDSVAIVRAKLQEGLSSIPVFAEAAERTPRTIFTWIAEGLPVVYIGRTPYIVTEPGIAWLRSRKQRQPEPRGRGRPRNNPKPPKPALSSRRRAREAVQHVE